MNVTGWIIRAILEKTDLLYEVVNIVIVSYFKKIF